MQRAARVTWKRSVTSLLAIAAMSISAGVANAADDPRDDASPWAIASGAEWSGDYPRFNPMLRDAGVRWLRLFDEWQTVQPKRGEWRWEGVDQKVANARENGIRIVGGLWFFAPWASATGDTRTGPVKDIRFWRDYTSAAMERYKADIKYWEVWNEFNGSFYNSRNNNKPKEYADLVRAAYDTARAVDPTLKVGISCANFDLGFFDAAIKAGAAGHFDFVAVHPYENLGLAMEGSEASYLSLAGSIRKMLADNKQPTDMPLWITEIGVQTSTSPDATADARQADALVKSYVLSMAQGFEKIFWFEARGPAYGHGTDHGIIRPDWSSRPAYDAMKTMTGLLGPEPKYVGWLDVNGGYGFVFKGKDGDVLVAWAPVGPDLETTFTADITVVGFGGERTPTSAGAAVSLGRVPTFITGIPANVVEQARANSSKPFPWGGNYADAAEVSTRLAATNIDKGITQVKLETTDVVHLLDQSYRRSNPRKGGEGNYVYFRIDPQFAGFGNKDLEITVVARRLAPDKAASMQITYESLTGYKAIKGGRWTIPAGDEWSENTWTVNDANFVGGWGWNFRTDGGGSPSDFLIREVRVKRAAGKK